MPTKTNVVRIPIIATSHSSGSRQLVPIYRDAGGREPLGRRCMRFVMSHSRRLVRWVTHGWKPRR